LSVEIDVFLRKAIWLVNGSSPAVSKVSLEGCLEDLQPTQVNQKMVAECLYRMNSLGRTWKCSVTYWVSERTTNSVHAVFSAVLELVAETLSNLAVLSINSSKSRIGQTQW